MLDLLTAKSLTDDPLLTIADHPLFCPKQIGWWPTMDILGMTFSTQTAATATGCDGRKISDWATRGLIIGQSKAEGAKAFNRRFTFFNLIEIAVAGAAMDRFNVQPGVAFDLAREFAHTGSGGAGWAGDYQTNADKLARTPGLPFHHTLGKTYLVVVNGEAHIELSENGNIDLHRYPPHYGDETGFLILNLSRIFFNVCGRLGHDYREVLDTAYPQHSLG